MGPCAKQRVVAVVSIRGCDDVIVGENLCITPQSTCPRAPGEAYAKCITHCGQLGHAEETALRQVRMSGYLPTDITGITVYGHTGPCDHCRAMLRDLNLLDITVFRPDITPQPLSVGAITEHVEAYNLVRPSTHSRHAVNARVIV